ARRGLIAAGKVEGGLGYGLLPFVVGIYEMQVGRLDGELAQLFETYYRQAFGQMLAVQPSVHRVIPVNESVRMDMEIRPYESAAQIIHNAQAWGVVDCICRMQKLLIGQPCMHPLDVCMVLSDTPNTFANSGAIHSLSREDAIDTLDRAARAGLVHSVSNSQEGLWYICNCCTCSCGILRGMADLGIANVVARSAYMSHLADETLCTGCGSCHDTCQFNAISLDHFIADVNQTRCVGCGLCVQACPSEALALLARPADQVKPVPQTEMDWLADRAAARGLSLEKVL
ncbi:MAG: ATP-binding protein, partial [Anaerolineae bacterium]